MVDLLIKLFKRQTELVEERGREYRLNGESHRYFEINGQYLGISEAIANLQNVLQIGISQNLATGEYRVVSIS